VFIAPKAMTVIARSEATKQSRRSSTTSIGTRRRGRRRRNRREAGRGCN
jgi:hypothetical protein